MEQILKPNEPDKLYSFYSDQFHNIIVKLIWDNSKTIIEKGHFQILDAQYSHELKTVVICDHEPNHNFRLELHADFDNATPGPVDSILPINLDIPQNGTVQFALVRYTPNQGYHTRYHCRSYGHHTPDVGAGGVVKKP